MAPRFNMATMRSRAREAIESKRCALLLGFGMTLGVVIVVVSRAVHSLAPHRAPLLAVGLFLIVASSLVGLWPLIAWLRRHASVSGGRRTRGLLTRLMPDGGRSNEETTVRVHIDQPPARRTGPTLWQTVRANRCPILLGFAIALGIASVSLPSTVASLTPYRPLFLAVGIVMIVVSSVMCLLGLLLEWLGRCVEKLAGNERRIAQREAEAAAAQGTAQNSGRQRGKAPMVEEEDEEAMIENLGSDGGAGSGAEASKSSRLGEASHKDYGKNEIEKVD